MFWALTSTPFHFQKSVQNMGIGKSHTAFTAEYEIATVMKCKEKENRLLLMSQSKMHSCHRLKCCRPKSTVLRKPSLSLVIRSATTSRFWTSPSLIDIGQTRLVCSPETTKLYL